MPRPPSDIAARITAAARERFLRQGVDGASLRSIADDAGTNIGMVYYYFKTKDDLFLAVFEDVYEQLLADIVRALEPALAPEQRILALYERIAAMDAREFAVVRLLMREALISSERLTRIAVRFEQGHLPMVMRTLAEGVAGGRFDAQTHPAALAVASIALALLPQIMHRLLTAAALPVAAGLPGCDETAHALFRVLLFGIAGPSLRPGGESAPELDR
jgi:AcrR family transcriptional regulator